MATYEQITYWINENYGYKPKTCWIAHAKELCGLNPRRAHNRQGERKNPCPPNKLDNFISCFKHFGHNC